MQVIGKYHDFVGTRLNQINQSINQSINQKTLFKHGKIYSIVQE